MNGGQKMNKSNGLAEKLRKNPFLLGLGVIIFAIVLIAMFTLISAVNKKTSELEALASEKQTTQAPVATLPVETQPVTENAAPALKDLTVYDKNITSATPVCETARASITVGFKDKTALLEAHFAKNAADVDITPVFIFYLADGTALECPAQFKFLDGSPAVSYFINDITDLKNAFSVSDSKTVDFDNLFTLDFNLYIAYNASDAGKTLLGSASNSAEALRAAADKKPAAVSSTAAGIKKVDMTRNGKVVWLDIWFDGAENYSKLNFEFKNNFIGFRYTDGGKNYDSLFTVTRYDSQCMIRCKFDTYSLEPILAETGNKSLTVDSLFNSTLTVFASDYDRANDLFVLN